MAYYSHDGVRHNTKEEALSYYEEMITEVPNHDDQYVKAIHNADWGKYEIQCVPQVGAEGNYLELSRVHMNGDKHVGVTVIQYNEAFKPDNVEDLIAYAKKMKSLLDMVVSETKAKIVEWGEDGKHLTISDQENDIPLNVILNINHGATESLEPTNEMTLFFQLDEVIEGRVEISEETMLEDTLKAVESTIMLELEGEVVNDRIDGYNLFYMIDTAERENMSMHIKLTSTETQENVQEA